MTDLPPTQGETPALLMLPLVVDVRTLPIMIVGGEGIVARIAALDERHATQVHVFADDASAAVRAAAGSRLTPRTANQSDFDRIRPRLLFVADATESEVIRLHGLGRSCGALVHVQDKLPYCDFHMPAILRRGQLQVSVSTGGAAPGLSRILRDHLAQNVLGPEWEQRLADAAGARQAWKAKGLSFPELARALTDFVRSRGWLKTP